MQTNIFDFLRPEIKISKPIRLIELFGGYGSQAMALKRIGARLEHWKLSEWEIAADKSYNAIHNDKDFRNYAKGKSREQLARRLWKKGISNNGSTPMEYKQIKRMSVQQLEKIYNSFCQNQNLGSITKIKGKQLNITDTDKYTYMLTYSFPCTDLSISGKQKGMKKGSGTRSGLLWEVERLLTELKNEGRELPQILFMENVPQVIGSKNIEDFRKWEDFLTSLGYTNYYEILNAKDYGVAQNRERCYMFSFLGEYNYKFPKTEKLKKRLRDYLEQEVEERYYIRNEKAKTLIDKLTKSKTFAYDTEESIVGTIYTENSQTYGTDLSDIAHTIKSRNDMAVVEKNGPQIEILGNYTKSNHDATRIVSPDGLAPTVRECHGSVTAVAVENDAKINVLGMLDTNGIDQSKRVYDVDGLAPTITTMQGGNMQPKIIESDIYKKYSIRKLTPIECGRLMGVSDSDIVRMIIGDHRKAERFLKDNKGIEKNKKELTQTQGTSNSKLYKQFGNSIVVDVMCAMFQQLNIEEEK